jgi:hypothetical protein
MKSKTSSSTLNHFVKGDRGIALYESTGQPYL